MTKLFGADGIRGEIDVFPLDSESLSRIAAAVGLYIREKRMEPVCLIGSDTRESSQRLKCVFVDRLNHTGVGTVDTGILPTSAVSYLVAKKGLFSAGIMFSASHNPINENGIKVFNENGVKLKDGEEDRIESYFNDINRFPRFVNFANNVTENDYGHQYARQIAREFKDYKWGNLNVMLDCANGASHLVAPTILESLGCKFSLMNAWPDGININQNAGSEYARHNPDHIIELLAKYNGVVSISLDGDADRAVLLDKYHNYYDGDSLIALLGLRYHNQGILKKNKVVTTIMSNPALCEYLEKNKILVEIVSNGDKYVTSALLDDDLLLGGEQIGHIVIHNTPEWVTGDGIRTALTVLSELAENPGSTMMDMLPELKKYPQIVVSVYLDQRTFLKKEEIPSLCDLIADLEFDFPDVTISQCRPASTESCYRLLITSRHTPVAVLISMAKRLGSCIYKEIRSHRQEIHILDGTRGGETIL
jgi:phosphoglucosamine mutase